METSSIIGILAISLPLGMLHALDPDHVLAVATLCGRESNPIRAHSYALHWAAGHGGLLLLITVAVLCFHWVVPQGVPYWAERSVGVILILTGTSVLWNIRKERLHERAHGEVPPVDGSHTHGHRVLRAPLLIGVVHGTAGSAVFLALLPAAFLSPALGLLYVVVFSIGVLAGMVGFAALLRFCHGWLERRAQGFAQLGRGTLAAVAMGAGIFWVLG